MDNETNQSQKSEDIRESQAVRPNNQNVFFFNGLVVDSQMPTGNLKSATCETHWDENRKGILLQFYGSCDVQGDEQSKSWFHFCVSGICLSTAEFILFRFKNANIYRKFLKQRKYRPYVMIQQEEEWKAVFISKLDVLENQVIEAQFKYEVQAHVNSIAVAANLPYSISSFQKFHQMLEEQACKDKPVYYHREVIAESVEGHPIFLCTITATSNIANWAVKQPSLWPYHGDRPYSLKNRPEIVVTARVHPSETASSFWLEGFMQSLVCNQSFLLLAQMFIFRIVPIVNPDGVENGNYRLDNYFQNLNRFYGHSSPSKTPSVYAIETLIASLREKNKLFMFLDIHGHNSPKPSFAFGNYCQNVYQSLENKTFVKILDVLSEGTFDSNECEFSKRNMLVKEKYDEHSKEASARVFAYRGNLQKYPTESYVQHSYTIQVQPYLSANQRLIKKTGRVSQSRSFKNLPSVQVLKKSESVIKQQQLSCDEIIGAFRKLGQSTLIAISELLGVNYGFKIPECEEGGKIRKRIFRDLMNLIEYYDRSRRSKQNEINREMMERYCQAWNLHEILRQFLKTRLDISAVFREKKEKSVMFMLSEELQISKQKQQKPGPKKATIYRSTREDEKVEKTIEQHEADACTFISYPRNNLHHIHMTLESENRYLSKPMKSGQKSMKQKGENQLQNFPSSMGGVHQGNGKKNEENHIDCFSRNEKKQLDQLQERIRKLIFRHKTDASILQSKEAKHEHPIFSNGNNNNSNNHNNNNNIKSKNREQPKTRFHLKTEQNGQRQQKKCIFNDQQFLQKRQTNRSIQHSNNKLPSKAEEQSRNKYQFYQYPDIIPSIRSIHKTTIKADVSRAESHLNEVYETINYDHQPISLHNEAIRPGKSALVHGRLRGYHKSAKGKLKKMNIKEKEEEESVHELVNSFKILTGNSVNRMEFIKQARKILSQKRRNESQSNKLPVIREFEVVALKKH